MADSPKLATYSAPSAVCSDAYVGRAIDEPRGDDFAAEVAVEVEREDLVASPIRDP
jgi:hypothetical protein